MFIIKQDENLEGPMNLRFKKFSNSFLTSKLNIEIDGIATTIRIRQLIKYYRDTRSTGYYKKESDGCEFISRNGTESEDENIERKIVFTESDEKLRYQALRLLAFFQILRDISKIRALEDLIFIRYGVINDRDIKEEVFGIIDAGVGAIIAKAYHTSRLFDIYLHPEN